MKKTVVIHQPDFIPYIGFFHRLLDCDLFVILDDVQFLRRGWHHRDKIKTPQGEKWLTLGLIKSPQETKINEILLKDDGWKEKHLDFIKNNYKKSKFFHEVYPYIEKLYVNKIDKMIDFNMLSIKMLLELFEIEVEIVYSSKYEVTSKANNLLVDILEQVSASHYLSGTGAKNYFEKEPFEDKKIEVIWQDFKHPVYPQLHGEFVPYLSSIDMLFNCGIENSREILRNL